MKRNLIVAAVAVFLFGACKSNTSHNHQHEHSEAVEHHDHSDHDHSHHNHNHQESTEHHHHEHEGEHLEHHDHSDHNHSDHEHAHQEAAENHHEHSEAGGDIILSPEKAAAAGVVAKTVQPEEFSQIIQVSGRIEPSQNSEKSIVANVAGIVQFSRPLTAGTQVSAGTPLLSISAEKLQDGSPVERARIAYQAATEEYERAKRLIEDRIISEKDFNAIRERYENASLTYQAVSNSGTDNCASVTSPSTGYIKNILVREGDYVTVGQTIATIAQDDVLYLIADIPERYYGYMNKISSANFSTTYSDVIYRLGTMNGKKVSYSRALETGSGYASMTFSFSNDGSVVPGSYARIYLIAEPKPNTITVPVEALIEEQGLYFVFLKMCEESYTKRQVKTGASDGSVIEILDGVHAGDNVVVQGAYHVKLASTSSSLPAHSHSH